MKSIYHREFKSSIKSFCNHFVSFVFYSYSSTSINIKIVTKTVDFRMIKGILIETSFEEKNTFHVVKFYVVK